MIRRALDLLDSRCRDGRHLVVRTWRRLGRLWLRRSIHSATRLRISAAISASPIRYQVQLTEIKNLSAGRMLAVRRSRTGSMR
jgi:hypothetical protein